MEQKVLEVAIRKEQGKRDTKQIRSEGFVPAVFYGKGQDTLSLVVPSKEIDEILHSKAGINAIINLKVKGKPKLSNTAIIKEIQTHPLKPGIFHVDFKVVSLEDKITVTVPIETKGEPDGVKEGGVLDHTLWEIEIECLPTEIPESIKIDVSSLKIGDSFQVKEIKLPVADMVFKHDLEDVVLSVMSPKVEQEAVPEEEEIKQPEVITQKKEEPAPEE